jgi:signal transduction histidine kinase
MMDVKDNTYHILIVDDVPNNIKVVANILQRKEYKLFFSTNGRSVFDKAKTHKIDLILLDVMMPDMDGFEVCQQLRNDPETQDIPVIFLTAKADTDSIVKGFEVGGMDYVTKPFNGTELFARVNTHLELRRAKEKLQTLNATKDKFFSIIAHDLRSPFTAFLGLTEAIAENIEEYNKDEIKRFLGSLHTSAETVYALLENLLAWSQLQREVIGYHPEYILLPEVVGWTLLLFQSGATQKQITLQSLVSEELKAYADPKMVNTVMRNLISNALKFTNTGGRVEVSAKTDEQEVEIAVADTGIGISEEIVSKLFRIETKHSKAGTAGEKGTGLGLILCKELVERNGGRVWVESEAGNGSTFRFTLPRSPIQEG